MLGTAVAAGKLVGSGVGRGSVGMTWPETSVGEAVPPDDASGDFVGANESLKMTVVTIVGPGLCGVSTGEVIIVGLLVIGAAVGTVAAGPDRVGASVVSAGVGSAVFGCFVGSAMGARVGVGEGLCFVGILLVVGVELVAIVVGAIFGVATVTGLISVTVGAAVTSAAGWTVG